MKRIPVVATSNNFKSGIWYLESLRMLQSGGGLSLVGRLENWHPRGHHELKSVSEKSKKHFLVVPQNLQRNP